MLGIQSLITMATLPLLGVYCFLFYRVASSAGDQRPLLSRPRWMAVVNIATMVSIFFVLTKLETQLGRLIGVAGSAALVSILSSIRRRQLHRRGLNPSLLSRFRWLDLLAALCVGPGAIVYVLGGT